MTPRPCFSFLALVCDNTSLSFTKWFCKYLMNIIYFLFLPKNFHVSSHLKISIRWCIFSFCKLIYFKWRLITLQYCSVFAIHWHESATGVHMSPIPNPPSHLPPPPIPLGHPSAPAPRTLYHASNLDWSSISHMVTYMFQCNSLKSSHPRLPFFISVSLLLSCT